MESTDFSMNSFYEQTESERNSLGFMELLGYHHHHHHHHHHHDLVVTVDETTLQSQTQTQPLCYNYVSTPTLSSVDQILLINPPATPNYSYISSASSEAVNELEKPKPKTEEDEENEQKGSKKKKKKKQKRENVGRVAFMTKSEVDHLEDGYRWRKYGQKAVKNSPFPRSYYRCTTASCSVKKRVERSFIDPTTVVTTYEGQHSHISPLVSRPISTSGSFFGSSLPSPNLSNDFVYPIESSTLMYPHQFQQQTQQLIMSSSCFGGVDEYLDSQANEYDDDHRVKKSRALMVHDYGLLQDIVPSHIFKEDYI
ncbi:unnamed protein product [Cochlearia groenlandica]